MVIVNSTINIHKKPKIKQKTECQSLVQLPSYLLRHLAR